MSVDQMPTAVYDQLPAGHHASPGDGHLGPANHILDQLIENRWWLGHRAAHLRVDQQCGQREATAKRPDNRL
jgi:hypothetical protein